MRPTLEEVKARLGEAGAAPPPRPRPDFVDALESRLVAQAAGGEDAAVLRVPGCEPAPVRPRRVLLALAAVGVVLAALVVAPSGQEPPSRVRTVDMVPAMRPEPVSPVSAPAPVAEPVIPPPEPAPSPAVTVVPAPRPRPVAEPGPKGAAVPVPAPTTSTVPPAATPTSPVSDPKPVSEPPPATTTSPPPPAPEGLALRCHARTRAGGPQVSCEWSESTSPEFAGYRLMRKTASGAVVKVFATRERAARSFIDTAVKQGERYGYVVEAKDASGRVIARSGVASVTCCPT